MQGTQQYNGNRGLTKAQNYQKVQDEKAAARRAKVAAQRSSQAKVRHIHLLFETFECTLGSKDLLIAAL